MSERERIEPDDDRARKFAVLQAELDQLREQLRLANVDQANTEAECNQLRLALAETKEAFNYEATLSQKLKAALKESQQEVERLKRGEFTPEEFQNLCHHSDEWKCPKLVFFDGCADYQRKLYGEAERDQQQAALKESQQKEEHWHSHYDAVMLNWEQSQQRVKELEHILALKPESDFGVKMHGLQTREDIRSELIKDGIAQQSALQELAEALQLYQDRMASYGEWDDGCFYYNNKSASELEKAIEKGRTALAKAAQFTEKSK